MITQIATVIGFTVLGVWTLTWLFVFALLIREGYRSYIRTSRFLKCLTADQRANASWGSIFAWWFKDIFNSYTYVEINGTRVYRDVKKDPDKFYPG